MCHDDQIITNLSDYSNNCVMTIKLSKKWNPSDIINNEAMLMRYNQGDPFLNIILNFYKNFNSQNW